jgi:hypothetical protein
LCLTYGGGAWLVAALDAIGVSGGTAQADVGQVKSCTYFLLSTNEIQPLDAESVMLQLACIIDPDHHEQM